MSTVSAPPIVSNTMFTDARRAEGTLPFRNIGAIGRDIIATSGVMPAHFGDPKILQQASYSAQSPVDRAIEQAIDGYQAAVATLLAPYQDPDPITPSSMTVRIMVEGRERTTVHSHPGNDRQTPAVRQAAAATELLYKLVMERGAPIAE